MPGANAAAARVLLHLARVTGDTQYRRRAEATLATFTGVVAGEGLQASTYLTAVQDYPPARPAGSLPPKLSRSSAPGPPTVPRLARRPHPHRGHVADTQAASEVEA